MRVMSGVVLSLLLGSSAASGQSLVLQGSAGPTVTDAGYSVAAGFGFSPTRSLTVLFDVEQTHLSSRVTSDGQSGGSAFRGGTFTFAAVEVRASLRSHDCISPYLVGGAGIGVSRPNVNEIFVDRITNKATTVFGGGGIQVPLREGISAFADVRIMLLAESDVLAGVVPVRAGVAWRF